MNIAIYTRALKRCPKPAKVPGKGPRLISTSSLTCTPTPTPPNSDAQCAVLLVLAIFPMLISRELTVVARYSRNSIIMMLFLSATMVALAATALIKGKAARVHILPTPLDPDCPSQCGTLARLCIAILSVLSVSCLAFTCQVG